MKIAPIPKVSVIIPLYNEGSYVKSLVSTVSEVSCVCEIILVNDGSKPKFKKIYDSIEGVKIIHKKHNEGKDKALHTGYKASKGDYLMMLDGDLQGLKGKHLNKVLKNIPEYDIVNMVIGVDMPIAKILGNTYITTGQRIISREVLEKFEHLLFTEEEWTFESEVNKVIVYNPDIKAKFCELEGVGHILKTDKYGTKDGLMLDVKMIAEILFVKYGVIGYLLTYAALSKSILKREKISKK